MFLEIMANPHSNGRLTRVKTFETAPGQRYAVDAERLHADPALLNRFGQHNKSLIRALDGLAYTLLCLGIFATFVAAWWTWIPALMTCSALLLANRNLAGGIACSAAQTSTEAFFHLHTSGLMWLVSTQPRKPAQSDFTAEAVQSPMVDVA